MNHNNMIQNRLETNNNLNLLPLLHFFNEAGIQDHVIEGFIIA